MPRFALTFDDGPGPSTPDILDSLKAAGVRATFFVLGKSVAEATWSDPKTARALVVRALHEGHVVGNHTFSHARPDGWRGLAEDLRLADDLLRACRREAGLDPAAPIPVRLPYGIRIVERTVPTEAGTLQGATIDPRLAVLASLGRTHVHWTGDFDDWTLAAPDAEELAARMLAHVEQTTALGLDAVLDLHDGGTGSSWGYARPATAGGVRRFLAEAARRGWTHRVVPEAC